jgi:hypothetical protein
VPFLVSPDGDIYDGHQRQALMGAIREYGPNATVDVRVSSRQLTDDERRELVVRLKQNQAGWDFDMLPNLYDKEELLEWGFEPEELGMFPADDVPDDPGAQVDKAAELQAKWGTATGQLWQLGDHRLICGDCTDAAVVARVMGGERAQAVVTDPPYPDEFKDVWWALGQVAFDACHDDAFLSSLCGHYQLPHVMNAISSGGWSWWWLCIATNQMQPIMHGYSVKVCHKPNVVYRKGKAKPRRLYVDDFALRAKTKEWQEAQDAHKWGQAVSLFVEPIEAFSDIGAVIYEPFCGGGTTLIACERLGRRCRAVEIEPGYVAVALQRFYDMTGIEPVLLSSSDFTVISNG